MASIFNKIISGEIPCHKVMEDELHLAFLDINPVRRGHTLVIPKREIDYIFDLDDIALGNLMAFARKVAILLKEALPCLKVGVMVAGLEVPHAHVHLIPIMRVSDLDFQKAAKATEAELKETAALIRGCAASKAGAS
jgi:histidine triad (HIT) family protein